MEPITTNVTYISNGSEEDLRIFDSLVNSAQIDMNAREADRVMFTTPRTKYANEGFSLKSESRKLGILCMVLIILVILLIAFQRK